MTIYKEIRKLTGNNKVYAAAAMQTLIETCWWVSEQPTDVMYFRSADNDWVAIPDVYSDCMEDAVEFTTVCGKSVILGADKNANYLVTLAE